ncbi:MAG: helix-turn-helix transcriptional regulator [Planctomycetota bacterium]|jgi:AraC-like DNA-binding protein
MPQDLRLQILSGLKGFYDQRWAGGPPICDDFSRLYILQAGGAEVESEDGEITLCPGRVYLFPSGSWARYRCPRSMVLSWVHFRLEAPGGFDCLARWTPQRERVQRPGEEETIDTLMDSMAEDTPTGLLKALSLLGDLIAPFLPEAWDDLLPPHEDLLRLAPVITHMEGILDRSIELEELAGLLHLHPTYLSNLFCRTFGVPPLQYHIQLRLRRARELLLSTEFPIVEVAARVGYGDQFYFSRLFKRHVGIPPKRFRQMGGTLNQAGGELKRT